MMWVLEMLWYFGRLPFPLNGIWGVMSDMDIGGRPGVCPTGDAPTLSFCLLLLPSIAAMRIAGSVNTRRSA